MLYRNSKSQSVIYSSLNDCGQHNADILDDMICYDLVIKWKVNSVSLLLPIFLFLSTFSLYYSWQWK